MKFKSTYQFRYILNPLFVISLILLISNDFVFKALFNNWITGKLSDFSGIIVFTLFFSVFFKKKKVLFINSGVLFTLWKSGLSQSFIDYWNHYFINFNIGRVTDYSDLICLLILFPLFYFEPKEIIFSSKIKKKIIVYPLLLLSIISITATSRVYRGFYSNDIYINETVKIKQSKSDFLGKLTNNNVNYILDTTLVIDKDLIEKYILENIILEKDTIYKTYIGIKENRRKLIVNIEKIIINTENDSAVQLIDYKDLEKLREKYGERISKYLNEEQTLNK